MPTSSSLTPRSVLRHRPLDSDKTTRERPTVTRASQYYSIIDVMGILTDSPQPRVYWSQLKERVKAEGFNEALAHIEQLKLKSPDNRFARLTPRTGKHSYA